MTAHPSRAAWLVAAGGQALLCAAFWREIAAAVTVWNQSTAYGHCWLVLPIAGWLLWERRGVAATGAARPSLWPALAAIPMALVWVAADWLGLMEGRQLALIGFAETLLMAALGWRLWWALSPAFLYLVFLVPFGAFLTPSLQLFTTNFILAGLRVLDIPFDADAFQITIPEGSFYVAEACAGLRFLIASVAFGVLYAVTIFRSPWRRAAFIAVACFVPVVANGFRGLGIVLLGHVLGSAEAGAADHLIYGWVFFSAVIILLALGGLPFREDMAAPLPPSPGAGPARRPALALATCLPVLLVAFAGPVALGWMSRPSQGRLAAITPAMALPPGCVAGPVSLDGAVSTRQVQCGTARLHITATTLSPGTNPARVLEAGRAAAAAALGGDLDSGLWRTPAGAPWTMLTAHSNTGLAAYAVWVDGVQAAGGLRDRFRMARDALRGDAAPLLAVAVDCQQVEDAPTFRAVLAGLKARQEALPPDSAGAGGPRPSL